MRILLRLCIMFNEESTAWPIEDITIFFFFANSVIARFSLLCLRKSELAIKFFLTENFIARSDIGIWTRDKFRNSWIKKRIFSVPVFMITSYGRTATKSMDHSTHFCTFLCSCFARLQSRFGRVTNIKARTQRRTRQFFAFPPFCKSHNH